MLQNRLYRGGIVHQGEPYPGQHEAILDPELWQIVQNKLAVHWQERALAVGAEAPSLLAGLIVDAGGNRMTPTHAQRKPSDTATKRRRRSISTVPAAFWPPHQPRICWYVILRLPLQLIEQSKGLLVHSKCGPGPSRRQTSRGDLG